MMPAMQRLSLLHLQVAPCLAPSRLPGLQFILSAHLDPSSLHPSSIFPPFDRLACSCSLGQINQRPACYLAGPCLAHAEYIQLLEIKRTESPGFKQLFGFFTLRFCCCFSKCSYNGIKLRHFFIYYE